jgi:K+-sensing histidine kinase KdpD
MALALIPATIYVAVLVPDLTLAGALLLLLCEIVVVAATTTLWVAAITAVASFLLTNWFLVPPYRTLFVASTDDVIVLLTFLGSAVLASLAVTATLRSQRASALAQIEAVQLRESVSTPAAQVQPGAILHRLAQI